MAQFVYMEGLTYCMTLLGMLYGLFYFHTVHMILVFVMQ